MYNNFSTRAFDAANKLGLGKLYFPNRHDALLYCVRNLKFVRNYMFCKLCVQKNECKISAVLNNG